MEKWRDRIRNPEDRELVTFIELAHAAVVNNPGINDEDFRLLSFNLGHDVISILQIGWNLKSQVDFAEKRGVDHAAPLRGLWERGLKAGLFSEMPTDGLNIYRKALDE